MFQACVSISACIFLCFYECQCIQPHACVFTIQPHTCGCIRNPGVWMYTATRLMTAQSKGCTVQPCFLITRL